MSDGATFVAVVAKTLSGVEVDPRASHQHELAAGTLRRILVQHGLMPADSPRSEVRVGILRLVDDEDPQRLDDVLTVYDARHANPGRAPEWRAYYGTGSTAEHAITSMREGDLLAYAIDRAGGVHVLLAPATSHWAEVLKEALDLSAGPRLTQVDDYALAAAQRRAPMDLIADAIGITPAMTTDVDWLLERFGGAPPREFPDPKAMAELAHLRVGLDPGEEQADSILEQWLSAETDLFMLLERLDGERRLAACKDFDDYIETVQSILQRRRVRRGRSLELHLEALFAARGLRYERQVETEPGSTSDFILPGIEAYRLFDNSAGEGPGVIHLGAKSTARERWKQVLSEASKLPQRHLATLDPQLSHASLDAMRDHEVVPVMPARLGALYRGHDIMPLETFIERARWMIS